MKNLKRALTLVLACAMIFGMFAINASATTAADFSDNDAIVNTEAVKAMTQLNIIKGYEDGSYKPTQVVTRAEMCKMLCIALNGGVDPVLGADALAVFSDTQGHWANPYISYCFNKGIVSGDAGKGGTFRPEATVTGTEAAKMMLVALGYNSSIAGFTGADWAINVGVAANEKSLFGGLATLNVATGLSRDNAAQLIYNGLSAKMVTYENVLGTNANGELTSTPRIYSLAGTILTEKYHVSKVVGVLEKNDTFGIDGTVSNAGYSRVDIRSIDGYTASVPSTAAITAIAPTDFKVAASSDLLGQEVALYVKKSGGVISVVGDVVATDRNKVATTYSKLSAGTDTTANGSLAKYLKEQGLKLVDSVAAGSSSTVTDYGVDGATLTPATGNNINSKFTNARGAKLTLIDNDNDGEIEYALTTNYVLTKVSANNTATSKITLAVKGEIDYKDVIGEENVAKGDYVLYTVNNGTYTITKAETVTGTVSAFADSGAATASFTVNDTKYSPSAATNEGTGLTTVTTTVNGYGFSNSYIFYLDAGKNPIAWKLDTASGSSNYAVVLSSGASSTDTISTLPTGQVKLELADGTTATYTVDMVATANKYIGKTFWTVGGGAAASNVTINSADNNTVKTEKMGALLAKTTNTIAIGAAKFDDTTTAMTSASKFDALAGTIVTYAVGTDGKVTLAPTDFFNGRATGGNLPVNTDINKGIATWNTNKILTDDTIFLFYNSTTGIASVIKGLSQITTTISSANITTYVADASTNVVKVVYIAATAPNSSATFAYIGSSASTVSIDGKEYYTYNAVLADGTAETFTALNTVTNIAKYTVGSYTKDANGRVNGWTPSTVDTFATGLAANLFFKGYVTAVNGTIATVTNNAGQKFAFDTTGKSIWNVVSATKPFATEVVEGNEIIVMTDATAAPATAIKAVYVTKTTSVYSVTVNGTIIGNYQPGTTVTVEADVVNQEIRPTVAVTGWNQKVAPGAAAKAKYTFTMPTNAVVVNDAYTVTFTGATATAGGTAIATTNFVATGATVVVTEIATAGTGLTAWTGVTATETTPPAAGTAGVYTFTMPAANVTVAP